MPKIIDTEKPIEKQIKETGVDPIFLDYLFDLFIRADKIPMDSESKQIFGGKNIIYRVTIFSKEPVKNTRNTDKLKLWLAVSYMADYFLEKTGKPHWRLIEGFLHNKKAWGKTPLSPKWYGRGKKRIEDYSKDSYRPPLNHIKLLYDDYKKFREILARCNMEVDGAPPFYAAKNVYC